MSNASELAKRTLVDTNPGKLKRFLRKAWWLFSVYLGKPRTVQILTRNGLLRFWSKDKTTGRILHVYRNHEFDEIADLSAELKKRGKLPEHKDSLLDVGGYIGMSSTAFLLESFFDRAYAFEPSPRNFQLLQQNTALNGLENRLFAFNVALSDATGVLEFELSEKNNGDNRIRHTNATGAYDESSRDLIKVPSLTLDDFLAEHPEIREDSIGLIWMDIQGHEPRFFAGAKAFLKRNLGVPVYMEFWPYGMNRSGANMDEFFDICKSCYKEFVHGIGNRGRPIAELRDFYSNLERKSKETNEPGYGANILLI
jgi:FkbM family methyltransferase